MDKQKNIMNLIKEYDTKKMDLMNSYIKGMEKAPLQMAIQYKINYNIAFEYANNYIISCVKKYAKRI